MLSQPPLKPAGSYAEAVQRVQVLQSLDDDRILPQARTALLEHGAQTRTCVVLLHGFTNHPGQYREFAPLVHARGANVLIPRMPEQGDRDRLTKRMSCLTAQSLLDRAWEAVDIAQGLGERVCIAGISSSGLLCTYFALTRGDVSRAVAVAPVFAMLHLPYASSLLLTRFMLALPDRYLWWDPRVRDAQHPATAYPWFSTHALAQTMLIAQEVFARSKREKPKNAEVVLMTNVHDPAVNNHVTHALGQRWRAQGYDGLVEIAFTELPRNHDIIEPDNPKARTEIVYPRLLESLLV